MFQLVFYVLVVFFPALSFGDSVSCTEDDRIVVSKIVSVASNQFSLSDVRFRYGDQLLPLVPSDFTHASWYAVSERLCKACGFSGHVFHGMLTALGGAYATVSFDDKSDKISFISAGKTPYEFKAINSVTCR
jgi:hypothetical protein